MRKTLLALILVIPMIFVVVIFSSVNLVSLGVPISASGIKLHSEDVGEDGSILIDMAKDPRATVVVEVLPGNATEKGYTLSSSDPEVAEVTQDGLIVPKGEGTAEIVATSNDKGFTDSIPVVVVSSRPYDFDFSLTNAEGKTVALTETDDGYRATLPTGRYTYGMDIHPMDFTAYSLSDPTGVFAEIERGTRSVFLPFTGETEFHITVEDGIDGPLEKTVHLKVEKPSSGSVIVNGDVVDKDAPFSGLQLAEGTQETKLYVECSGGRPTFQAARAKAKVTGSGGRYTLEIAFDEGVDGEIQATLIAGGKEYPVLITFTEFAFSVFSDSTVETLEDGTKQVSILAGTPVTFYAVAAGGATGVEYVWSLEGHEDLLTADGNTATVSSSGSGSFVLTVEASYRDTVLTETIKISIINKVSAVKINNEVKCGLAECYTIAGMVYGNGLKTEKNVYPLLVYTYSSSGFGLAGDDITYTVLKDNKPDDSIATVDTSTGTPVLIPKATGTVTVVAAWKGNDAFGKNVQGSLKLNIVMEAVEVKNAPELTAATDASLPVVLTNDIKLGTDANGKDFTIDQRLAVLKTHLIKSTYNTEWYKYTKETITTDERITNGNVNISYALEFKNDVYGNGKSIDASNYTHCHDANRTPLLSLYRGPLFFVNYRQMASVAGQDNCAFLIRTDGVKLYGVNLLGCDDSFLADPESGQYDVTQLNLTGTTLEVNASAEIVNCRIRNGRNVIRAYGGNRNGDKYFIDNLSQNTAGVDSERIHVKIEGCILAQGREFILKIGANRALRASLANGQQPALVDQSGKAYNDASGSNIYNSGTLYEDPWFYKQYVMTDVTLKDSVLETSGLFTVGVESNFAGEYLYPGGESYNGLTKDWEHSGGTSFASVLRLEGNVRLYDWKDILLVNSSTLIESPVGALSGWLNLNIASMLEYVTGLDTSYNGLIETTSDGKKYVHGGIAYYGGGRNYACIDTEKLESSLSDFTHVNVNIGILANGKDEMHQQGTLLPKAAGTHDFNFYMYGKDSANDFVKQKSDEQKGIKYKNVLPVPLFAD